MGAALMRGSRGEARAFSVPDAATTAPTCRRGIVFARPEVARLRRPSKHELCSRIRVFPFPSNSSQSTLPSPTRAATPNDCIREPPSGPWMIQFAGSGLSKLRKRKGEFVDGGQGTPLQRKWLPIQGPTQVYYCDDEIVMQLSLPIDNRGLN